MKISELKAFIRETVLEDKELMKQLLISVLQEGLGSSANPLVELATQTRPLRPQVRATSALTTRQAPRQSLPAYNPALDEVVTRSAKITAGKETGSANIMQSILADTARTTLPQMIESDRQQGMGSSHVVQEEQIIGTPEQNFGEETVGNWANLAFPG
jgi:hypothetical protein